MTPKPRYLIIFRESKADGARRDQYTIVTQRVFTDLEEAIAFIENEMLPA
jgi:hypothetical protein